jgi:methylase of polypeptide subunit release factors
MPDRGAAQYFADGLVLTVIVGFRRTGSAVEITDHLPIPRPTALLDWKKALDVAVTASQQDLLRRALHSRHKIVIQRNVLVYLDRENSDGVFGPSIDTVFLNDWLFDHAYRAQRVAGNDFLFEDTLTRPATALSYDSGKKFLEIGCGNGLLTASWVRNQARIKSFAAIDVSVSAISSTYHSVVAQRRLHRSSIASRGIFIVAPYRISNVQQGNDLVVCNPPYVPIPPGVDVSKLHHLTTATVGTDLLAQVISDVNILVAKGGELAVVISQLAYPELSASVPSGWTCQMVGSMTVPFNIEAIEGPTAAAHINWLESERGLRQVGGNHGSYEHDIAIYVLRGHEGVVNA